MSKVNLLHKHLDEYPDDWSARLRLADELENAGDAGEAEYYRRTVACLFRPSFWSIRVKALNQKRTVASSIFVIDFSVIDYDFDQRVKAEEFARLNGDWVRMLADEDFWPDEGGTCWMSLRPSDDQLMLLRALARAKLSGMKP